MSTVVTRGILITLTLISFSVAIYLGQINRTLVGQVIKTDCIGNACFSIITYKSKNGDEKEIQLETRKTSAGSTIVLEYNKNFPEEINACCRRKNLEKFFVILGVCFLISTLDISSLFVGISRKLFT